MKSVMPFNLDDMLVVAITARALFDRHESDQVHAEQGLGRWGVLETLSPHGFRHFWATSHRLRRVPPTAGQGYRGAESDESGRLGCRRPQALAAGSVEGEPNARPGTCDPSLEPIKNAHDAVGKLSGADTIGELSGAEGIH